MSQNKPVGPDHDPDVIPEIDDSMLHQERIEFESRMSALPLVSLVIALACVVVYAAEGSRQALTDINALVHIGALDSKRVFAGEYWRMLSCTFLHGGFDHLIGNMLMLYILGMACEHAFGRPRFVILYVIAGLAGSGFSLAGHLPSVGASGAIFGLAGALIALFARHQERLHLRDHRIGLVLGFWALYQLSLGLLNPAVDNRAHLGGLIGGVLAGWLLEPALLNDSANKIKSRVTTLLLAVTVCFVAYSGYHFVPRLLEP